MQIDYFLSKEYSLILVTVSNLEDARKIAKTLVEERLAACVSIIPQIISTYRWQNEVNEYSEVQLFVKTQSAFFEEIERRVKTLHPATLPEIIELRMNQTTMDYKMWLFDETKR